VSSREKKPNLSLITKSPDFIPFKSITAKLWKGRTFWRKKCPVPGSFKGFSELLLINKIKRFAYVRFSCTPEKGQL